MPYAKQDIISGKRQLYAKMNDDLIVIRSDGLVALN